MTWPGSGEVDGDPDPVTAMQVFTTRHSLLRVWGEFQQTRPLIVAPVCTSIPFEAGVDLADGAVAATILSMRMATAVNALGLPAVAVPVGTADELPQVVQVIGPATVRTCAWTRRRHWRTGPGPSRPSTPDSRPCLRRDAVRWDGR